jgi:hypothetical protein
MWKMKDVDTEKTIPSVLNKDSEDDNVPISQLQTSKQKIVGDKISTGECFVGETISGKLFQRKSDECYREKKGYICTIYYMMTEMKKIWMTKN